MSAFACSYCLRRFDSRRGAATHERWCRQNPSADLRKRHVERQQLQSSFGSNTSYAGELFPSQTEAAFAELLDEWGVEWDRYPDPLPWRDDSGRTHLYYPDFYSAERDRYYEPGRLSAAKRAKLSAVTTQNSGVSLSVYGTRQIHAILSSERGDD